MSVRAITPPATKNQAKRCGWAWRKAPAQGADQWPESSARRGRERSHRPESSARRGRSQRPESSARRGRSQRPESSARRGRSQRPESSARR
jgi:hypothetical protein